MQKETRYTLMSEINNMLLGSGLALSSGKYNYYYNNDELIRIRDWIKGHLKGKEHPSSHHIHRGG